ncbi:MAG: hypothetical protein AAGA42_10475 [Actinomycetota bacterium]
MSSDVVTSVVVRNALDRARGRLAGSGTWWDAARVGAIVRRADAAFTQRATAPWMRELPRDAGGLGDTALAAVDRVATNAGTIDREWASAQIDALGDAAYVELVGIVAVTVMLRMYAEAAGEPATALRDPAADAGQPTRQRPDGMIDIGAYVDVAGDLPMVNVVRALSLVPSANETFLGLVAALYAGDKFTELVWEGSPLSRPQVELVASRVAAMNECFY